MPTYLQHGATFSGPVVYVGDGDSLCIGVGDGPQGWVEVRLADFYAPELATAEGAAAKATLVRLAMGKAATCVGDHQTYGSVGEALASLSGIKALLVAAGLGFIGVFSLVEAFYRRITNAHVLRRLGG